MTMAEVYAIRSRYTSPDNGFKPEQIKIMGAIAIAYDVASLVGEIEKLNSEVGKLRAELIAVEAKARG